ncbi:hypothetical protein BD413DRAFT_603049 [Trametes elegans]|nr:hypothetical protein BD413DRAFT_603049 [Trametes elegans]
MAQKTEENVGELVSVWTLGERMGKAAKPRNFHPPPHIYDDSPEELVGKALKALQEAGIQLIEWKTLLYRRMGVPVIVKDYHYLVPDESLTVASRVLEEDQGLARTIPPPLLLKTGGDFYARANPHRLTQYTSMARAQHLVLYPASLASYAPSELEPKPPLTAPSHSLCEDVLVPSPPAVYASILRMMRSYSKYAPTRIMLESDLSELIGYNLYGLEGGFVDVDDEELCEELAVDRRVEDAVSTVKEWRSAGQLGEDSEEWIADALVDIVAGKRTVEDVPWADASH